MKAWVGNFTGDYFQTDDNCSCSPAIATPVKPKPSLDANREIKIQKEITRLLREQAIKNLGLTPEPIPLPEDEPTPIIKTPGP
jgi:hypothetical protein